jgi:L-Ala-D/L-Glu epimerase
LSALRPAPQNPPLAKIQKVNVPDAIRTYVEVEKKTLANPFVIARGRIEQVEFVTVRIEGKGTGGWGEACPTPHYGESPAGVLAQASEMCRLLEANPDWTMIHDSLPAGAARNAVDCAFWDWRAKQTRIPAWKYAGLAKPGAIETVFTIGLDRPEKMAQTARPAAAKFPLLKVKLGADGDDRRICAIRTASPGARLIVDANEGWTKQQLLNILPILAECGVELVEQPLPAGADAALEGIERLVPICADESCHVSADIARASQLYDIVNIKLDKTGGLTEALRVAEAAREAGMDYMVGCMLGTSLAMAPALLLAQNARYVDLDAPLLMGTDREPRLHYRGSEITPAVPELWG